MAAVGHEELALRQPLAHLVSHLERADHVVPALHEVGRDFSQSGHVPLADHLLRTEEVLVHAVVVRRDRVREVVKQSRVLLFCLGLFFWRKLAYGVDLAVRVLVQNRADPPRPPRGADHVPFRLGLRQPPARQRAREERVQFAVHPLLAVPLRVEREGPEGLGPLVGVHVVVHARLGQVGEAAQKEAPHARRVGLRVEHGERGAPTAAGDHPRVDPHHVGPDQFHVLDKPLRRVRSRLDERPRPRPAAAALVERDEVVPVEVETVEDLGVKAVARTAVEVDDGKAARVAGYVDADLDRRAVGALAHAQFVDLVRGPRPPARGAGTAPLPFSSHVCFARAVCIRKRPRIHIGGRNIYTRTR